MSRVRRGRETANDLGQCRIRAVGDFLYSRLPDDGCSRQSPSDGHHGTNHEFHRPREVMQLINSHDPQTTQAAYLETITRKTARFLNRPPVWVPYLQTPVLPRRTGAWRLWA